jgi:nicotinamidase-related amidase
MQEQSSVFSVQELTESLSTWGIDHIYLVGIFLGECITGSASDGLEKDFRITVIEEAVTAKKSSRSKKYIKELSQKGVEIISLEEFEKEMDK